MSDADWECSEAEFRIRCAAASVRKERATAPQWLTDLQQATDDYVTQILSGNPPTPPCTHRYCRDQGYGLCMGVAGAQIDMMEDNGLSRRESVPEGGQSVVSDPADECRHEHITTMDCLPPIHWCVDCHQQLPLSDREKQLYRDYT
jgi:hypothetical protein